MTMKLSRRDKIIFLILVVAAVFVAGGLLLIKPQYENMEAAQARLAAKEQERDELQAKIDRLPGLEQQLKEDVNRVSETQKAFLNEREYNEAHKISMYIKDVLTKDNPALEVMSINFTDSTATNLDQYTAYETNANYDMKFNADIAHQMGDEEYWMHEDNYPANLPSATVGGTVVTMGYRCPPEEYETVYNMMDAVAKNKENIYLNTISAEYKEAAEDTAQAQPATPAAPGEEEEESFIEGEIVITVYEVYYMDPADVDKV